MFKTDGGNSHVASGGYLHFCHEVSEDETIVIDVIINVSYGSSIVSVAREVQDKLLSTVQSVTGFEKARVNVHVAGISFDK